MNCREFRKRQVESLDIKPMPADLLRHIEECPQCAREHAESQAVLSALIPTREACASSNLKERIMSKAIEVDSLHSRKRVWARPARFALAAMMVLAVVLGGSWFAGRNAGGPGSALAILSDAAEAAGAVHTVHITARMRTPANDNFDLIVPDSEFTPVEIWSQSGDVSKWRVEKPGRVAAMDGEYTLLVVRPGVGSPMAWSFPPTSGVAGWLTPLLDVDSLLDHEKETASADRSKVGIEEKQGRIVLTIQAAAKGDFSESEHRKNTSVLESDNIRVYAFDAKSRRLEGMEVYVETDAGRTLVFETTNIEYDAPVTASLFELQVPKDAVWQKSASEMPGTRDNSAMTPRQVADAVLTAMANEDWDGMRDFAGTIFDNKGFQDYAGGLTIISIGKPFKSGLYRGWFVPYEVKLKSGDVKKYDLAIRNDNPRHQWEFDGGF